MRKGLKGAGAAASPKMFRQYDIDNDGANSARGNALIKRLCRRRSRGTFEVTDAKR